MKAGWEIKNLGETCRNLDSMRVPITKNKRVSGDIPYYGASGVVDYVQDYLFNERLLLVSEDGANLLARTYPIAFAVTGKSWINNHAHVLRFENEACQNYTEYYLNSIKLDDYVTGMAQPKLNQKSLNSIQIPIPPLAKQKQIVALLDQTFKAIDQAQQNIEKNISNAKELFLSFTNQLFINLESTSPIQQVPFVCSDIFAGGDAPKNNFSKEKTNEYSIPIIANAFKNKGLYGYTNQARVTEPSITIAARGSGTGYTEIRNEPFYPIVRLIVLTPNTELITLDFLKYSIKNLTLLRSGSAIPQLTIPMIKAYSFPLPEIKKQQQIVKQLDELNSIRNSYVIKLQDKIILLEELKKSILQKAFNGELT